MDPLLWWTILLCLIVLITVFSLYLCYNVYGDNLKRSTIINNNSSAAPKNCNTLNKYKFEINDVEDLTSIEKDYQIYHPKISFVNEVETPRPLKSRSQPDTPIVTRKRKGSLLYDIHESSDCMASLYSVEDIMSEVNDEKAERRSTELLTRRFSLVTEGMRRNSLATMPRKFSLKPDDLVGESTDTLDCLDPITVETKRAVARVEDEAHKIEYEIGYFVGGCKNLKYYEINERLIRLNMTLSELECGSEELRKLKKSVQGYINECKEKLNNKVA